LVEQHRSVQVAAGLVSEPHSLAKELAVVDSLNTVVEVAEKAEKVVVAAQMPKAVGYLQSWCLQQPRGSHDMGHLESRPKRNM
jgi:hypothetical protein